MKALISPNEPRGEGLRVAEVMPSEFAVAEPLFWVDCPDEVVADMWIYLWQTGTFEQVRFAEEEPEVL